MNRRATDVPVVGKLIVRGFLLSLCAMLMIAVHGCGTTTGQAAPMWGTLKLIERGVVDPDRALAGVEQVQSALVDGVTLSVLGTEIREALAYRDMQPSDRMMLDAVLTDAAAIVPVELSAPLTPEHIAAIEQRLTQLALYIRMYKT